MTANVRPMPGLLSGGGGAYLHTARADDASDAHHGYDSRCGWCWLGAPHTVDAHATRLDEEAGT